MTLLATEEGHLTLKSVHRLTAEEQLREVPSQDVQMNYLASLAYDAIRSGKFGDGPFEVTFALDKGSFAIIVDGSK